MCETTDIEQTIGAVEDPTGDKWDKCKDKKMNTEEVGFSVEEREDWILRCGIVWVIGSLVQLPAVHKKIETPRVSV